MKAPEIRRLKEIREHLGITQEKFAEELGIKQGSYSAIEQGKVGISSDVLKALIYNYKIRAEWLMLGEGSMFASESDAASSRRYIDHEEYGETIIGKLENEIISLKTQLSEALKDKERYWKLLEMKLGKNEVSPLETASDLVSQNELPNEVKQIIPVTEPQKAAA